VRIPIQTHQTHRCAPPRPHFYLLTSSTLRLDDGHRSAVRRRRHAERVSVVTGVLAVALVFLVLLGVVWVLLAIARALYGG
jgi:hypothetical protein